MGSGTHYSLAFDIKGMRRHCRKAAALFFVDDLIESGDTQERTINYGLDADFLGKFELPTARHVGTVLIEEGVTFEKPDSFLLRVRA